MWVFSKYQYFYKTPFSLTFITPKLFCDKLCTTGQLYDIFQNLQAYVTFFSTKNNGDEQSK